MTAADLERELAVDRTATPLLRVEDLAKVFRQHGHESTRSRASRAAIWPGETLGLVGESGSGKTTFARALLGLVAPSGGTVELAGRRVPATCRAPQPGGHPLPPDRLPEPGLRAQPAPHRPAHPAPLAAQARRDLRRRGARPRRGARRIASASAIRHLPVRPSQLSGGLKQRVAIARAFAGDPKLVVCDEPTSALDVSVQAAILNLLVELQAEQQVSYLFISHDLGVVRYISDRIAVLYLGRLMELGPVRRRLRGAAPPVHRGAPLGRGDDRRRRARADQARGRHPERGRAAVRAASSTRAATARSARSASARSRRSSRPRMAT